MNKIIFFLAVIYLCAAQTNTDPLKEFEKLKSTTESCLTATKTKPEDLKAIWAQEDSESYAINCLMACIMKKTGTMDNDNKLNVEKEREALQQHPHFNNIMMVIEKCKTEETDEKDQCIAAKKHKQCFLKYKNMYNIPDHF